VKKPNLFDFATSELSQDAFLCWLLSWADRQYLATDEALHKTAIALMNRLLGLHKIEALAECESLNVERPYEDIDILVLVNGDIALLIEDKIDTSEHSGQLPRYLEIVREDFPERTPIPVYLKTGDQSSLKAVEDAGWKCFGRRDLLAVLEHGERLGVRSDIFADFQSRLRRIEEAVQDYRRHPVQDWGHDGSRWTGFFVELQARLGEGNWGKVAFPGNFMGFWWHGNGNKYLLLKEDQLCFKIHVPEKGDQVAAWQAWHDVLMAESRNSGLALQRPARRGRGKNMTVAVLDNYLQADGEGVLDLDRTVVLLRRTENLLDAAVARYPSDAR
jgi:hypothetical protein